MAGGSLISTTATAPTPTKSIGPDGSSTSAPPSLDSLPAGAACLLVDSRRQTGSEIRTPSGLRRIMVGAPLDFMPVLFPPRLGSPQSSAD
jgi:hypothetical protein